MNSLLIGALFLSIILLMLGLSILKERRQLLKRLTFKPQAKKVSLSYTFSAPWYSFFISLSLFIGEQGIFKRFNTPSLRQKVIEGGWINLKAPEIFIGALVLCYFVLFNGLFLFLALGSLSFKTLSLVLVIVIYLSYALPKFILVKKKNFFLDTMLRELPEFFELYIVQIKAGKNTRVALRQTNSLIADFYPQVARQIEYLLSEIEAKSSEEAWAHFAARVDDIEIQQAIKIIRHCELLGLPLERDLGVQINNIRQTYLRKLEEKIIRLPTTLLIPIVIFIFPTLFIIILTPAAIKISGALFNLAN